MKKTIAHFDVDSVRCAGAPSPRPTVVGKLVIAIGEVVWTPATANMLKRLLNLVGLSRSTRLSYT